MINKTTRFLFIAILLAFGIFILYKVNYKTLDEAIRKANVPYEETLHEVERNGFTIIFYAHQDSLSVGLLEKTFFGYKWGFSVSSDHFSQEGAVTWSVSTVTPQGPHDEEDRVTVTKGVVHDDRIKDLVVHYRDADVKATILETTRGRIWYSFSESPVNYTPDVTIYYDDGTTKQGWY